MNNIIYDDEIIIPEHNKYYYYKKFIQKLNKKDCVKLNLFCSKLTNPNTKTTNRCIELVEKWLMSENSVTSKQLRNAAGILYNIYPIISSHTHAAHTAFSAIYANSNNHNLRLIDITASTITSVCLKNIDNININLYLKTLLRTTKQYNTKIHNNQHYESILKEIINEDINKLTDTDYNMLIDISQEYYNINPNITNKSIFIELLRKEYA